MKKKSFIALLFLLVCTLGQAIKGWAFRILPEPGDQAAAPGSGLSISLLTVGVGDEIYASFGHTGIRVIDSAAGTDIVYNWGTFDGFQENFELKFMRGKLRYYASSETFQHFYQTYVREQRGVEEQELLLDDAQKRQLQDSLEENLKEENRYYKYDFLYDNCATRLRDVFPKTFGPAFRYPRALPGGAKLTFRDVINRYLARLPWERFGINLLLGSRIDQVMTYKDAMFLPDYLRDGVADATASGRAVSTKPVRLLSPAPEEPMPANGPLIFMLIFAVVLVLGSVIPGFGIIGIIARNSLLIVTGLLGCLMLFMWLGTDHQACQYNWNVLWALPTNLIIPFTKQEKRSRYAIIAIALILVSLLLHLLHIQSLPLRELWPLLASLLLTFSLMCQAAVRLPSEEPEEHHHH